jgi:hypothetical protein
MKLHELLDRVHDASSFLAFARALEADSRRAGAPGWENGAISDFLKSAIRWAEDSRFGESRGLSPENPWKQFATFLYCGKIYE